MIGRALLSALCLLPAWAQAEVRTSTAGVRTATAGPELLLDGLEDPAAASASATTAEERTGFEARADVLADLGTRLAAIADRTTLGGYGEHEFAAGGGEPSRFQAHRFVLFVYSKLSERIAVASELELEFGGSPTKRGGLLDTGEALLEFAVVDFELFPWLVLRAGIVLVPVGFYNIHHDGPTQELTDRPLAYTTIVPTTWFESGAGLLGKIPLGGDHRLSYELYLVNGLDARIFDGQGLRGARGSHLEDNNHDKALVGRVAYSPFLGLEVGASGYSGAYDLSGNRIWLGNLDLVWRLGSLDLLAEVVTTRIDPGFVEGFAQAAANTRDAVPQAMFGFYAQGNYHLPLASLLAELPEWLKDGVITAALRYEGKDTNTRRASAQGDRRRLTLGLNFRPIAPYVIKTDYQLESHGLDELRPAPDLWEGDFWREAELRFVASVAYLF